MRVPRLLCGVSHPSISGAPHKSDTTASRPLTQFRTHLTLDAPEAASTGWRCRQEQRTEVVAGVVRRHARYREEIRWK